MPFITLTVDDGVGTITIDRPEKKNAMTYAMLGELGECLVAASEHDDVRAVVLTGVAGAFCAGTDLSDLDATPEDQRGGTGRGGMSILDCPKPVVAAIDGAAVGMGAEFASMCDVRIASDRARFGWVFVHRGLVADTGAGTWLLPRLLGYQAAARLLFAGDIIDAATALDLGFLAEVTSPDDRAGRAPPISPVRSPVARRSPFARPSDCSARGSAGVGPTTWPTTVRRWPGASPARITVRVSPLSSSAEPRTSPAGEVRGCLRVGQSGVSTEPL